MSNAKLKPTPKTGVKSVILELSFNLGFTPNESLTLDKLLNLPEATYFSTTDKK